ncbi:uncharacterized protein RCC_04466 [Ramularia collo-cygni]|uniref:Uncharacterized protein n=1 Tax=Ramularia collo-cygni TaxID=112498 RepID=A0A2D3UPS3_9PEZI|nr:uncharacterized protein RCC_04466 [Ramularia collo-cygni]CZT18622.1 uncharacterized protein RCC_04466 [Ramularia collo-cygni]
MTTRTALGSRDVGDSNGGIVAAAEGRKESMVSRLPAAVRFPLAVLVSFGLSATLRSLTAELIGPELAAVSRDLTEGWQIGAMFAWKVAELAIAWYACYDYVDLAYLSLLNNVPYYFLLNTFFGVDYLATAIPMVIDVTALAIPFAFLRSLNYARRGGQVKNANQAVAQDRGVQYLIAAFGASIYAIVVYGSFTTWLPTYMIVHFDGLRSLERAHNTGILLLLALFGPLGYAATQFIFVPAIGSPGNPGITDPALKPGKVAFDPQTATIGQTVAWNLGLGESGLTHRGEILLKRTATLAASSFISNFVRSYVIIEGTELLGALGWASVWGSAAALVGLAYAWVGNE